MADNQFLIVVGLDIESYTNKSIELQLDAQSTLEQWIIVSCREAKIAQRPEDITWIDTGDGGYLLFTTTYAKAIPLLENLYSQLNVHNRKSKDNAAINIRAAVHCADAIRWSGSLGQRFAGSAVNVCARLLNGMNRRYHNQVVASRAYLEKIAYPNLTVTPLRLPDYIDKHGVRHEVWNIQKEPVFGVRPDAKDLYEEPTEWEFVR